MKSDTQTAVKTGNILTVRGLVSGYGRIKTINGIDVDVPRGEITIVIGPNGSGKSTFMKAVAGLLKTWEGSVHLGDKDITGVPAHDLVTEGLCMVPQGRVVFPMLTVEDNLKMSAYTLSKKETQDRIPEVWKLFPVLEQKRNDMANMLSGGEQVMLSLAKAVMLRPQLLLLDEPSLGLSPKVMDQVYDTILQFKKQGMTVLIVEQNVRKGLTVADNVVTLVLGDVRYQGPAADLEKNIDLGTLFMEGKL